MFSRKTGIDASAYEYDARYQLQSSEDRQWDDKAQQHVQRKPDYKPTPLRWYFVVMQIIFLIIAMGLVVLARQEMPNSDSTAKITKDRRWVPAQVTHEDVVADLPTQTAVPPESTSETSAEDADIAGMELRRAAEEFEIAPRALATSYFVSEVTKTVVVPGTTGKFTTSIESTYYDTVTKVETSTVDGSTFTSYYVTVIKSKTEVPVTMTVPGSASMETVVRTSTEVTLVPVPATGTEEETAMITSTIIRTYTDTLMHSLPGSEITTVTEIDQDNTLTSAETIVQGGTTMVVSDEATETHTSFFASVGTTTGAGSTYIRLEKTTIMSVYTDPNPPKDKEAPKATPKPAPKETVVDVISVKPDETIKKVETHAPVTFVTEVDEVETVVVSQPAPKEVVTSVGAFETLVDVVTTGWDGVVNTVQVASTIAGGLRTLTVADGEEAIVTSEEGYVTTIDVVTTGWDGLPTTFKVVSTVSGGLRTIMRTPQPTTYLTTRSGKLVTRTSSKGKSTVLSTVKGTTKTLQVSTTITPSGSEATSASTSDSESDGTRMVAVVFPAVAQWAYFVGKFLPAMIAVLLAIPVRIIDLNAQLYQPFYAMNNPSGAYGSSSMTLHYSGWTGFIRPFTTLMEGHPVPFLTMLAVWCTALMTPLATEAISMKIHGSCKTSSADGCAIKLGVSPTPTHGLIALIAFTIVLLCVLLFYLRNFETGLHANPWSIAGMASLATNREIRPRKGTERKIEREMADKKYGFGYFENADKETEYGIVLYDDAGQALRQSDVPSETSSLEVPPPNKKRRINPFIALGWAWRLCFTLFLLGLIVLTTFYHVNVTKPSAFKSFMNSQTFGVRFLFAALGVGLSFGWTALFISVAMIQPYQRMANHPQSPSDSILITRPTNGFSGLWASIKHKQIFPAIVAIMTILSEFMPILLANIPYTLTQTYETHVICARTSIAIMALMLCTLIASFLIKFPNLPIDPRSIAGAMYYVSESAMVDQFSGMARLNNKEREKRVKELGGRYWFGDILTKSGETRPAVERDDGMLGIENHPHHNPVSPVAQVVQGQGHTIDTTHWGYQGSPNHRHIPSLEPVAENVYAYDTTATYGGYYQPEHVHRSPASPTVPDQGYYQPDHALR